MGSPMERTNGCDVFIASPHESLNGSVLYHTSYCRRRGQSSPRAATDWRGEGRRTKRLRKECLSVANRPASTERNRAHVSMRVSKPAGQGPASFCRIRTESALAPSGRERDRTSSGYATCALWFAESTSLPFQHDGNTFVCVRAVNSCLGERWKRSEAH